MAQALFQPIQHRRLKRVLAGALGADFEMLCNLLHLGILEVSIEVVVESSEDLLTGQRIHAPHDTLFSFSGMIP